MNINNTRKDTWLKCRRLYYWSYIHGGRGIVTGEPRIALHIGHGVHAFLEEWYRSGSYEKAVLSMQTDFAAQRETYNAIGDLGADLTDEEQAAYRYAEAYVEKYPKEDFTVVAPEMEGNVPIGDGRHRFFFRLDMVVLYLNELWMVEHKTARSTGTNYYKGFMIDSQISGYVFGASRAMSQPIKGAILNVIKKTTQELRKKETREAWIARTFEREYMPRTQRDLDRFERTLVAVADEIEEATTNTNDVSKGPEGSPEFFDTMFPMNTKACTMYGVCPVYDLCFYGESPGLLSAYKQREADYTEQEGAKSDEPE